MLSSGPGSSACAWTRTIRSSPTTTVDSRHRHHTLAHRVRVKPFALHDELRAVAVHLLFSVLQELVAHVRGGGFEPTLRRGDAQVYRLFAHEIDHPGEERNDALTARVHNTSLLQDGQLLRRVRERTLSGFVGGAEHVRRLHRRGRGVDGRSRSPHNAEHRAFHRIADRLVARVSSGVQCCRKRRAVCTLAVRESAGEPLHELGEDDAAVAACAEQRPASDRAAHRPHRGRRCVRQLHGGRCAQRQQHVDTGVAVRHREDVEGVDGVDVGFEATCAGEDELTEVLRVERGRGVVRSWVRQRRESVLHYASAPR